MVRDSVKLLKGKVPREEAKRQARAAIAETLQTPVYLSEDYQVLLMTRGPLAVHLSVRRRDNQAMQSRRDLIEIAEAFALPNSVYVELYAAESRVVDTANQYHLWSIPDRVPEWVGAGSLTALAESAMKQGEIRSGIAEVAHLPLAEMRDWRRVQETKNFRFGPEAEAADLLVPNSINSGPCLLLVSGGKFRFPFGFEKGLRSEASLGSSRQRAFSDTALQGATS